MYLPRGAKEWNKMFSWLCSGLSPSSGNYAGDFACRTVFCMWWGHYKKEGKIAMYWKPLHVDDACVSMVYVGAWKLESTLNNPNPFGTLFVCGNWYGLYQLSFTNEVPFSYSRLLSFFCRLTTYFLYLAWFLVVTNGDRLFSANASYVICWSIPSSSVVKSLQIYVTFI